MKNKIKIQRAIRNITQDELASKCGLSRASINAIENGRVNPRGITMLKIAKVLQVPCEKIFDHDVVYKQRKDVQPKEEANERTTDF